MITLLALAAIVGLAELLRHPRGGADMPEASIPDPREQVDCPQPEPREGRERPKTSVGSVDPPVDVTSAILQECPGTFDGLRVRYEGEVVGGLLQRKDGTWALVNDDAYAAPLGPLPEHQVFLGGNAGIGVLLPDDLAAEISRVGGPGSRGALVTVTGTFHRVDDATGEVAVLEAHDGEVVRTGKTVSDPVLADRRIVAIVLGLVAAVVIGLERWVSLRRRR